MKLFRFTATAVLALLCAAPLGGCSDDEGVDNREHDYGYVQFRLYKDASYEAPAADSRAIGTRLDYLNDAKKVKVTLAYDNTTLAQTLALSATDPVSAEYGLRSDKLQLTTGSYRVVNFTLYDNRDEAIYIGSTSAEPLEIVAGGLTSADLTVHVAPRGTVRFTLVKANIEKTPATRASREYTFDEIAKANLTVRHKATGLTTTFSQLPVKFSIHFDERNDEEQTPGYRTSSSRCDSLLSLPAGEYIIQAYELFDRENTLLETNSDPEPSDFLVADNATTEVRAGITLDRAAAYLQDYYALRAIWESLDGPHWSYSGQEQVNGSNWNFNKDVDLWGEQPGVQLHSNGRVARINLSEFGIRGDMSPELGKLDQLVELYLGTHNDMNRLDYDPSIAPDRSLADRKRNRMAYNKEYLNLLYPPTQLSEPCARALREHGIRTAATELYDRGYTEAQLIDPATGLQRRIRPMDHLYGTICNGLRSLPESIGQLKNLEILYIANSEIAALPQDLSGLTACTDLELYNCPNLKEFPTQIAQMPELVQLNLSNNRQWGESGTLVEGLRALACGPSGSKIQILYCTDCLLTEVPEEFNRLVKLGLLDLTNNRITTIHPLGPEVAPVQLHLDNNLLESIPTDANGIFCAINDTETVSIRSNKLTTFPNIFDAKSRYRIGSIDLSDNRIASFPEDFKGVWVETLTLSGNPLGRFPVELGTSNSQVSYIILRGCGLTEIPKGTFDDWDAAYALVSLDLSYNLLSALPTDMIATNLPYLYGLDISYNSFSAFPYAPLNCSGLTVLAIRGQRNAEGERCLREWPQGIYQHTGLRGFYIGSNDLRKVDDTISYLIYYLDISDNPNITFNASSICAYWKAGLYYLNYDKTQNIVYCEEMLE